MHIKQLSLSYAAEQDRFLLRISSQNGAELRLWFTRRLTLGLYPVLKKAGADQLARMASPANPAAAVEDQRTHMLENFRKEASAYEGDFKTPYDDKVTELPLGPEPLLLTEVKLTLQASGSLDLTLIEKLPQSSRNVQGSMDAQMTQALLHLLGQALKSSGWLEVPQDLMAPAQVTEQAADAAPASADGTNRPKYLN